MKRITSDSRVLQALTQLFLELNTKRVSQFFPIFKGGRKKL